MHFHYGIFADKVCCSNDHSKSLLVLARHKGSYMSSHVLLTLLNEFGKKCEVCRAFYRFFTASLINSIMQEHKC